MANKKIELWEGYSVEANEQLLDDVDFIADLNEAGQKQNYSDLITMYVALVGGEETYNKIREHIEKEHGYFSDKALSAIIEKIAEILPKGGNRASRRSWKISR